LASKIHSNGVCRLRTAHIDGGQFTSSQAARWNGSG
jgi:hypothetical protein